MTENYYRLSIQEIVPLLSIFTGVIIPVFGGIPYVLWTMVRWLMILFRSVF